MISDIRKMAGVQGAIYFSSKSFERNPNGWSDSLQQHYYRYPAIVPAMPWIDTGTIAQPVVHVHVGAGDGIGSTLAIENGDTARKIKSFIIYAFDKEDSARNTSLGSNIRRIIPAVTHKVDYLVMQADLNKQFAVSCIDFVNHESAPVFLAPIIPAVAKQEETSAPPSATTKK